MRKSKRELDINTIVRWGISKVGEKHNSPISYSKIFSSFEDAIAFYNSSNKSRYEKRYSYPKEITIRDYIIDSLADIYDESSISQQEFKNISKNINKTFNSSFSDKDIFNFYKNLNLTY